MTQYLPCPYCDGGIILVGRRGGNDPGTYRLECDACRGTGEARCDECHGPATTLHAEDGREYALCDACAAVWRADAEWEAAKETHMTRTDHLAWCKQRALEYVEMGDCPSAVVSMMSDLRKHPETAHHAAIKLGTLLLLAGRLSHPDDVRRFIAGFN